MKERLRILIVDDDRRMASTLADILNWEGYEVEATTGALEALEKGRRIPFDCAISDIRMPGMDGFTFSQNLHQIQPGLPIILMSASPSMDFVHPGEDRVLAILEKPLRVGHLLNFLALLQQPPIVLLLDDDPIFSLTLGHILEKHGFPVKQMVDPDQVMAAIRGPEVGLLLDMRLNDIDGYQVLQQIRSRHSDLPVLIVTGYAEEMVASLEQALTLDKVYACLTKPVNIPELLKWLHRIRMQQLHEALVKR